MDSDHNSSDPDIEFIDKDSGMSSLSGSKDDTPERKIVEPITSKPAAIQDVDDGYDDEPDESLAERLWGLTEMFPDPIRNLTGTVVDFTCSSVKTVYTFSCNASWIFFTSSMILFAPVIFETERAQMEEMHKTQQKQVLLGPGSAAMGPGGPALPPMAAR